ncbi:hypothetical protein BDF21DRAFT_334496, partial [Thamnidium elegans]
SLQFAFEDGQGKSIDENGNEPILMDIDNEYFLLENITNYDTYLGLRRKLRYL